MNQPEVENPDMPHDHTQPKVAICVLNWKRWRDTVECLESLQHLKYSNYLSAVVDNGSGDGSADKIKAWAEENLGPSHVIADYSRETALRSGEAATEAALDAAPSRSRMVLIRNEENLGYTGGNNVAIAYALHRNLSADYVFLLNNDAAMDPDCLARLLEIDQSTGAGIVGPLVMNAKGDHVEFARSGTLRGLFFAPLLKAQTAMPEAGVAFWDSVFVHGGAMLVRKAVFETVQAAQGAYLDERLYLYWDEVAFCHTARKKGFKCLIVRAATVRHKVERTSGGYQSPVWYYYSGRNRVLLAHELLSPGWRILFHFLHIPLRLASVFKNLRARRYPCARAVLWGLIDGYRGVTGRWRDHDQVTRGYGQS
jgi:GT2 family glycosyltransferase